MKSLLKTMLRLFGLSSAEASSNCIDNTRSLVKAAANAKAAFDAAYLSCYVTPEKAQPNGNLGISPTLQDGLDYSINDHWSVAGQIISTANQQTPMVMFDADVRIGATVTYSF